MNNYKFYFVLILAILSGSSQTLRITKVLVPKYVWIGDNPKLFCDFDLEDDELQYVMWYKDGAEFAKIVPNQLVQTKEQRGLSVDKHEVTPNTIVLKDVTLFSTGKYQCKVKSKGSYSTVRETKARVMIVVEPPKKIEIRTSKETYVSGESLMATCLAYESNPSTLISWQINGKTISLPTHSSGKTSPDVINDYFTGIQSRKNVYKGLGSDDFFQGKNSSLQLNIQVQNQYAKRGTPLELNCLAYIGDLYVPKSKKIQVTRSTGKASCLKMFNGYIHVLLILMVLVK